MEANENFILKLTNTLVNDAYIYLSLHPVVVALLCPECLWGVVAVAGYRTLDGQVGCAVTQTNRSKKVSSGPML